MKYESLVEVARRSGFMGFCTGIRFDKIEGNRWAVTLVERDGKQNPHGTGASIGEAVGVLVNALNKWVTDKHGRALREKADAEEVLQTLAAAKEAGQ